VAGTNEGYEGGGVGSAMAPGPAAATRRPGRTERGVAPGHVGRRSSPSRTRIRRAVVRRHVPTRSGRCTLERITFPSAGGGAAMGRLVGVADTKLYVEERGEPSGFPLLVFHGGPGLDHTWFADYLDPLTEAGRYRLVLADERACGRSDRTAPRQTWTLERMAQDVSDLAAGLGVIEGY